MQKVRDFSLDQAVRATAGAGKTTGLIRAVESCYISHKTKHSTYPYILLTTFTIKAANELSERILDYALEKGDQDFLAFVSSHYLEIGTMHSTFMKVLSQISENKESSDQVNNFQSESIKRIEAKKSLHRLIEEENAQILFDLVGDDEFLVDVFLSLFEKNDLKIPSKEEFIDKFAQDLKNEIESGDEEYSHSIKEVLINGSLLEVQNLVQEKYSQKCKRAEKSYYKRILDLFKAPEVSEDFLNLYLENLELFLKIFKLWKLNFRAKLEDKMGYGISDIEWRLSEEIARSDYVLDLWDYCFFDEYQDTSPIQKKIISSLTQSTPSYFVGDPYQSIYYFRGARKDIFLNDFKQVEDSKGKTEFRLDNYRSAPEVVDFVNSICVPSLEGFKSMSPKRDLNGGVEVFYNEEAVLENELDYLFSKIKEVDLENETFAILSRNAKELMLCARFLKEKGISASISISKSFENSLEIVDLCSLLSFLNFPHDSINLLALLRSPWFLVSDDFIKKSLEEAKQEETSLWSIVSRDKSVSYLKELLDHYKLVNANEVLVQFLNTSQFLNLSSKIDPTGKREQNLWKFIKILEKEEESFDFDPAAFVDDILKGRYPLEKESQEPDSGCILMTVHASKGLQFDHVCILNANKSFKNQAMSFVYDESSSYLGIKIFSSEKNEKLLPYFFEKKVEENKFETAQESRRLFYVAMTRAKKNLFITGSGKISKSSYEPSWMKLILSLKESLNFNLVEELVENASSTHEIAEEQGGFLKNTAWQALPNEAEASSVTEQISSVEMKSQSSLSKLSTNITRGTLFHEFIERFSANDNTSSKVNNFFDSEVEENHQACQFLLEQKDFPFTELIYRGEKEWGFDYLDEEEKFSSGKIDLWGLVDNTLWIVDYKTGQSRYSEKGFKQLAFYAEILKKYLKKESLETKLVLTFPFEKKSLIKDF